MTNDSLLYNSYLTVSYTHLDVYKRQESILQNSQFVYMLEQASGDRDILAAQLNISPQQLEYVTDSEEGEGLIYFNCLLYTSRCV